MSVVRVVFLGTPEIASYCLDKMLQDEHFKVVGVISQPDRPVGRRLRLQPSPVKKLALDHGLEVMTPEKINSPEVLSQIALWRAEASVVVAFGQILPQTFLDLFPTRVVNVHTSLLPRWRGAAPIQRALMAGDLKTGVSLQVMVKKLDAGDVLGQREIELNDDIDALELQEVMKPLAADLLRMEFMDYLRGNLVPVPQEEGLVTYAAKWEKSESQIHWDKSAREIHNQRRGLALGPGMYTLRGSKKLKILKTEPASSKQDGTWAKPGTVIKVESESIVVKTGEGELRISAVQPESRSQMSVKDYLRGYPMTEGEVFGSL